MSGRVAVAAFLLSLGWLFCLALISINWHSWYRGMTAKEGERVPSGFPVVASLFALFMAYATVQVLGLVHVEVPFAWLWALLIPMLDVYGLGGAAYLFLRRPFRSKP